MQYKSIRKKSITEPKMLFQLAAKAIHKGINSAKNAKGLCKEKHQIFLGGLKDEGWEDSLLKDIISP